MERFSCATAARLANEDPIATAYPVNTYVLVECPLPWAAQAWESPQIPARLRTTIAQITAQYPIVKALLINQDGTRTTRHRRVIIYQRQSQEFSGRLDRYEFVIEHLDDAASLIENFFQGIFLRTLIIQNVHDILVCTHGRRDQCCGRYGERFYSEARKIVRSQHPQHQVWRSSHIGGHRFAPTAITFPDGRYYARLDAFSFNSLLQRSGDINLLRPIYRGSSLLPEEAQELERSLLLQYGWDWLNFKLSVQMRSIDATQPEAGFWVQLEWQNRSNQITSCEAQMIIDHNRTVTIQASCQSEDLSTYSKYSVRNMRIERKSLSIAS
jgi:hypothetical protein